jgi:hypothetical protein
MSRDGDAAGAPSHGPVDLDRLADYAAGALDPAAAAEVERRVRADRRWARALDALVVADEAVRAELRDVASAHPVQMPDDVAARIENALRELSPPPVPGHSDRPTGSLTSLADARAKRESSRRRFITGIGAAAATLVLVLCGITIVRGGPASDTAGTSAGGMPQQAENDRPAPAGQAPPEPTDALTDGSVLVRSSGANYTAQALQRLTVEGPRVALSNSAGGKVAPDAFREYMVPAPVAQSAPSPLSRLTGKTALAACLKAISAKYPGVPTLIDYARYEDRPALIVSVLGSQSTTVVAVGGGCGLVGPDDIIAVTNP